MNTHIVEAQKKNKPTVTQSPSMLIIAQGHCWAMTISLHLIEIVLWFNKHNQRKRVLTTLLTKKVQFVLLPVVLFFI